MILYNVTVRLEEAIHDDWVRWMKAIHIPDVMKSGLFIDYRMSRMLSTEVDEAPTYTIQYRLQSLKQLDVYQREFAPTLQKEHIDRYQDQALAFRTLMEIVDEG